MAQSEEKKWVLSIIAGLYSHDAVFELVGPFASEEKAKNFADEISYLHVEVFVDTLPNLLVRINGSSNLQTLAAPSTFH